MDYFWRPESITDPLSSLWHSFGVENTYNARGFITAVTDSTGYEWWSIDASGYDQEGRPIDFDYGNGAETQLTYDPLRPVLRDSIVTHNLVAVSSLQFGVDALGNFTSRYDAKRANYEHFTYDARNRLAEVKYDLNYSSGTPTATLLTMSYDDFGNIASRNGVDPLGYDVGDYTYNTSRTHAVTTAGSHTYNQYDANGNVLNRDGASLHWNSFNKPLLAAQGLDWSLFVYDARQSRRIQVSYERDANTVKKKLYLGAYELEYTAQPGLNPIHTQWKSWNYTLAHTRVYVSSPSGTVGSFTHEAQALSGAEAAQRRFFHYDHLGSIVEVTREDGSISESYSYSPWGERRNADTFKILTDPATATTEATDRGFTGHEMLDHLELVHMNARLFDPLTGRFLSPDSVLQFPGNIQSYDRYQYVLNNPLSYTDPSGHFVAIIAAFALYNAGLLAIEHLVVSMIVMFVAGALDAAIQGAQDGDIFKAGLTAAAMTAASIGIAKIFGPVSDSVGREAARAAAHGVTGGVAAEVNGGEFGNGFASSFVSSASSSALANFGGDFYGQPGGGDPSKTFMRTAIAAVVGGTVAEIGGGKFANGAKTAAIQHRLNKELSALAQKRDWDNMSDRETRVALNQLRHDNAELYSAYGLSHTDELGVIAPLTVKSADAHYRSGMGLPLLVDANTLSFDDVDVSDFKGKSTYGRRVVFGALVSEQDGVYGSLTLRMVDPSQGTVRISPDLYNFDQKPGGNWFRNQFTAYGSNRAGAGIPYEIRFFGTTTIDTD